MQNENSLGDEKGKAYRCNGVLKGGLLDAKNEKNEGEENLPNVFNDAWGERKLPQMENKLYLSSGRLHGATVKPTITRMSRRYLSLETLNTLNIEHEMDPVSRRTIVD